ncbi:MAG: hypothetical protein KatS3mg105_4385 [Gemmatales bacterium]|nr:MAG: hypothetical protein KatS3mg105_4385 [Gemmatales bacterium]
MLNKIYVYLGAALIGLYVLTGVFGWEWFAPKAESAEAAATRRASGGYPRGFWFFGYRGGK